MATLLKGRRFKSTDAGNHMIGIERLEAEELSRLAGQRQAGA
ncbi:hypothetical protein QO004_006249 [Rhizobium mesoamericanum]|nr:hypothetical protein [Rhizobium mesoamericanum]MDQ0564430.1 hypothetical protein [Rhizobium mesoamericanum]